MTEFERFLSDSLKKVGEAYEPRDVYGAKQAFFRRRRRRRWVLASAGLASAAVVVAALVVLRPADPPRRVGPSRSSDLALSATVSVGRAPTSVAIGHGSAWVANYDSGSVSRVDLLSNEVTNTILTDGSPDEIAIAPDAVWVTNAQLGSVQKIDPVSNEVTGYVPIGSSNPSTMDIAVSPQAVWIATLENSRIYRISLNAPTPAVAERLSARGTDIASDGAQVWAMDAERGRVVRIDAAARGSDAFSIPRRDANANTDLGVGFGALWVALGDAGTITRIDLATGDDVATAVGGGYSDLAVGPDGVWALTGAPGEDAGELVRLDPTTGAMTSRALVVAGSPIDVAAGSAYAWVVRQTADSASRIEVGGSAGPSPEPHPSTPTRPNREPLRTMWPELTGEQRAQAADRLSAGEDPWRRSAPETALEFARQVIGWDEPRLRAKDSSIERFRAGQVGVTVFKRGGLSSPTALVVVVKCIERRWWCVSSVGDPDPRGGSGLGVSVRGRRVQLAFSDQRASKVIVQVGYGDIPTVTKEMLERPFSPVTFKLPDRPGQSGFLMLRWVDARGRVFSAQGTTLPAGDFAAG